MSLLYTTGNTAMGGYRNRCIGFTVQFGDTLGFQLYSNELAVSVIFTEQLK